MTRLLPLVAILILAACNGQTPSTDPVVRGERYFNGLGCVKCHQVGEKGHAWGPDLTMVGFRKSDAWLDQWLQNPHGWNQKTVMPNFNLKEDIRKDLVAYLTAQKGQAWPVRPWRSEAVMSLPSAERGKLLFEKAGCVTCHGQEGVGGYPNNNVAGGLIPSLRLVTEGYTRDELISKVKTGAVPIPKSSAEPAPMRQMPKWSSQLKDDEIKDVVDYLFTFKAKAGKPSADDF